MAGGKTSPPEKSHVTRGPVWAEIDLGAIAGNLRAIRRHIGAARKILAVVKADAYGHGAPEVAAALARAGADGFGVTCTGEGAELREAGINKPILLLTGFWPGEAERQLAHGLTPTITDVAHVAALDVAAGKLLRNATRQGRRASHRLAPARDARVPFHLKIDTGMNRLGIPLADLAAFIAAYADCRHIRLEGTFTHFAAAEDFASQQTETQSRAFHSALGQLRAAGVDPGIVHQANSAAIASRPETWGGMVRPGALLYGYHQFYQPPERRAAAKELLPLRPALALRARVVSLKELGAGEAVGYNARYTTARPSRIAVIAAGYAEGVARLLTNRGRVILHGRCAPLVGVVSMDLAMADVTALPEVRVGDVATVFGADPAKAGCALYADDVAGELGTVTSELLCAIGRRVPRVYP
jgi:alanine racemase